MNIVDYLSVVLGSVLEGLQIMLEGFQTPEDFLLALPLSISEGLGALLG